MKYIRLTNTSDFVPTYSILVKDAASDPWGDVGDLSDYQYVGGPEGRVFEHFDEDTTNVEAPIELINLMYALAHQMGMRDGARIRLDGIGRFALSSEPAMQFKIGPVNFIIARNKISRH
jgi:hypothetical protein